MLKGSFYEITEFEISKEKDKAIYKVKLNPSNNIFNGHFPENPIVPGVCMVQMNKEIISLIVNSKLIMTTGKNIKFQNVVNPTVNPELYFNLNISYNHDIISVNTQISYEDKNFCLIKGDFKKLN